MGFYLDTALPTRKAEQLKRDHGARVTLRPEHLKDVPEGMTLICVVENGRFDAAAIVYSDDELRAFSSDGTSRPRTWMLMDTKEVVSMKPQLAEYLRGQKSWNG